MNSSVFARFAAGIILLFPSFLSALEVYWYVSDPAGIAYRETSSLLSRKEAWVMEIRSSQRADEIFGDDNPLSAYREELGNAGRFELAILREGGVERMRRTSVWHNDGSLSLRHTLQAGRERLERANSDGDVVEEVLNEKGVALERSVFVHENAKLKEVLKYAILPDASEKLIHRDRYRYRRDGSLRRIQREFPDTDTAALLLSSTEGRTRRMEIIGEDGSSTVLAFDDRAREQGRYARKEAGASAVPLAMTTWNLLDEGLDGESQNVRRIEYPDAAGGGRRVEEYNSDGELVLSILYDKDDAVLERTGQLWEAGALMSILAEREGDLFETRYERDERGAVLVETKSLNGLIQRIVRFSRKDGNVLEEEEVYVNGSLRLIVRRENGVYIGEERIQTERKDQ